MQKITVIGNLGKDIEERVTGSGVKLYTFSIGVSYKKDQTIWYECVIWSNKISQFEKILSYLKKGSRIVLGGTFMPVETYQDKQDNTRIKLKIDPDYISFVGSPQKKEDSNTSYVHPSQMDLDIDVDDLPF